MTRFLFGSVIVFFLLLVWVTIVKVGELMAQGITDVLRVLP